MILIELKAAVDAAGTVSTFYVTDASSGFLTSPMDTPASIAFLPLLIDPGSIGIHAYADGQTGGATRLETGEIVLANVDGRMDSWVNYSFDGRPQEIRSGSSGAYPGSFPTVLAATADGIEASMENVIVRLRDRQYIFDRPVLTTRYAGNNSMPSGVEGTANDLKGKVKPRAIGKVLNVSPPMPNTSKLTVQVSDGAVSDIPAMGDKAAALTKGANYTSVALLQASIPAAGSYNTCFAQGYAQLGTSPAGQVTADVTQGALVGDRTVAQILKRLALDAGLTSGEISSSDVSALDAANASVVGIWIDSETTTFRQVMDQIAASIGAWYGMDAAGVFRMGRLAAPSGTPVVTLYDYDILDRIQRRPPKDNGMPVWRVTVRHSRIWTTQESDLAGAVSAATRAYLAQEYRSEVAEDATVKNQWMLAREMVVDTLLTSAADAATEASRLLAMYKVRRDIFDVTVRIDVLTDNNLKLMDVVSIQINRFGMDSGRSFRLIGMTLQLARGLVTLSLWG